MDVFTLPPPCQHRVSLSDVRNGSPLRLQPAFLPGGGSTVSLASRRPKAPAAQAGAVRLEGRTPAYHIHLHEQDPQGEALAQALQPLVDVVRVEVVVAEAGKGERKD